MNQHQSIESFKSDMAEDIRKLFCQQKCRLKSLLGQRMRSVSNCEAIHRARLKLDKNQDPLMKFLNMLKIGNLQAIIILFSACVFYIIWAAIKHNHAMLFGNGGCLSTSFWTEGDCTVAF